MKLQEYLFLVAMFCLSCTQPIKCQTKRYCPEKCGNVTLEFPFGTTPGCYHEEDPSFKLTCNERGLFFNGSFPVVNISHSSQLSITFPPSYACYNESGHLQKGAAYYNDRLGNLTLSDNNTLFAVGCDTYAFVSTRGTRRNSFGCISVCEDEPLVTNRECNGEGCCQNPVSAGSSWYIARPYRFVNDTSERPYRSSCIYAFVVEDGKFKFNDIEDGKFKLSDKGLVDYSYLQTTWLPVVLDWSIGGQKCNQVGNGSLCSVNSTCSDSTVRTGYVCKCEPGYYGNPYLKDGCKDINECNSTTHEHNCTENSFCENTNGSFWCPCKTGYHKENFTMSCSLTEINEKPDSGSTDYEWAKIFLGTTIGFLCILLVVTSIQQRMKHRKTAELRQHFFEQNGGGMLIQRLSGAGPSNVDVKIFTEEGMKEATSDYDDSRILGQGGQGTVYKGILPDNSIVAIKKARLGDCSQVEQFINEVLVLSQINHRNVVKLLGCCLETEVPLLVYEFINSGTLFDHLHGSLFDSSLTWEHRLRIAVEIAGTLAYLHSSASIPIIHRDVKTANILLDENLTAKVADFGASRLIPMDKEQLTTMVQGTLGYLDPEYYNTGLLNEKSDVYSFGVVLMELLTGQKALCFDRPQYSKHLVSYFTSATKEKRLHEVIDGQVMNEKNQREIQEAARVAVECTRVTGEERPKMKEVAAELEGLRATKTKHQWSDNYPEPEETEHLLGLGILSAQGETSSTGYDSIKNVAILDIEAGR